MGGEAGDVATEPSPDETEAAADEIAELTDVNSAGVAADSTGWDQDGFAE